MTWRMPFPKKYSELSLLEVAETRFASHIITTSCIHQVKSSLEKKVMDEKKKLQGR